MGNAMIIGAKTRSLFFDSAIQWAQHAPCHSGSFNKGAISVWISSILLLTISSFLLRSKGLGNFHENPLH